MPGNNINGGIRLLHNKEIERKKWDNCIKNAVNELPYAYTSYLDCVCVHWDALVLNDYEAVFPLTWNKKAGVQYLFQPFFTQQLGVFSIREIKPDLLQQFLESIPEQFRLIEINLNTGNIYTGNSFKAKKKLTHHLLLDKQHEEIKAGYNNNATRNLKKALKQSLTITPGILPEELIGLFKKNKAAKIKELKNSDYERLKNLMEVLLKNKTGEIIGIKTKGNRLCAAGFFVHSGKNIINLFTASSEEGKDVSAMFLLIDFMLKKYEQSGLLFDFEGSEISSIARFYKGFGAQEVYYWHIRKNNLPWHLKWLKK